MTRIGRAPTTRRPRSPGASSPLWAWLSALLLAFTSSGCTTAAYYAQAVTGQSRIVLSQRPVQKVINDPATPPKTRQRLELLQELRRFAHSDLHLPVHNAYEKYADVGRRFVVWNVTATPEFSLSPKTWWYPIIGHAPYRGFFNKTSAQRYAQKIAKKHRLDTAVSPIEAYSTLGWFEDPVLNTWIQGPETDVAETLFHELAHRRVFVPGDGDFNEAFATAVGQEGVRRWLLQSRGPDAVHGYESELQRRREFIALIRESRSELAKLYHQIAIATPHDASASDRWRADKNAIFDQLRSRYSIKKTEWNGNEDYDAWFRQPLNNAHLSDVITYDRWVPAFRQLLLENAGNLDALYLEVQRLGKLPPAQRRAELDRLRKSAAPTLSPPVSRSPELNPSPGSLLPTSALRLASAFGAELPDALAWNLG